MKKIALFLSLIFILSISTFAKGGKKLGKEITLKEKTKISTILENPESFIGKKVLIEGTVVNVCKMKGCWIEIAGDKEFQSIVVKVNDGEIVFPLESKGKKALVEGSVYAVEVKDDHKDSKKDDCGKKGEECVHKTKKYLIKGIGAVIDL